MKKAFLLLIFPLSYHSFGQKSIEAEKLVDEGLEYHDKGDFEGAILKYNKALLLDKDNIFALAEKSLSLLSLKKYDQSIQFCQRAIAAHPGDEGLKTVYVTYGNALDVLKKTDKSMEIYDAGIQLFPDYYPLYYNKGITLAGIKKTEEALSCFEKAVLINPQHASSHSAIGRLSNAKTTRIRALLAFCRFLSLEQISKRAEENLSNLQLIMVENVEETGKKSVTIRMNAEVMGDTTADGKPNENSFTQTDLILSLVSGMDFDKKYKKETKVERFIRKFESVCASLKETKKDNYGFFWDYYVPYFIEMKDKNLIETFGYIAFATSEEAYVSKWLKSHDPELEKFFAWSKSFEWSKK